MFKLFKKKKDKADELAEGDAAGNKDGEAASAAEEGDAEKAAAEKKPEAAPAPASGPDGENPIVAVTKLSTEVDRIKASVEGFAEVRKSLTERMSGMSEQIGELRAMIMDRDRTIQELELKAVKAADLVETVQPEKLMIELQKGEAKFEALKANLEGNEAIMDRVMEQVRDLRKKLEFFRGIEEIVKLGEEVKQELVEIKKTEASVHVNADKVETIYSELRKKYQDADLFNDSLQEFKVSLDQNTKDVEGIKSKMTGLADKADVDKLTGKMQMYVESLKELHKQSSLTRDLSQLKKILEDLK